MFPVQIDRRHRVQYHATDYRKHQSIQYSTALKRGVPNRRAMSTHLPAHAPRDAIRKLPSSALSARATPGRGARISLGQHMILMMCSMIRERRSTQPSGVAGGGGHPPGRLHVCLLMTRRGCHHECRGGLVCPARPVSAGGCPSTARPVGPLVAVRAHCRARIGSRKSRWSGLAVPSTVVDTVFWLFAQEELAPATHPADPSRTSNARRSSAPPL